MISTIIHRVKTIYLLIRFSALGFTVFLAVLGLASSRQAVDGYTLAGVIFIAIAFHIHAYVFNDVIDLEIDKTEPFRAEYPLVRGEISKSAALLLALSLVPLTFVFAQMLTNSLPAFVCLACAFGFMALYNLFGKRIALPVVMDAVQGMGWSSLVFFGAQMAGGPLSRLTLILAGLAFVYTLMVNGIHGALRDLENDSSSGARTTATIMGVQMQGPLKIQMPRSYTTYAIGLQMLFIILSLVPMIFNWFGYPPLQWWLSFSLLAVAHLLSLFLFYCVLQVTSQKWDLFYYGMLHLVLTLGTFLMLFIFTLSRTWLLILLFFYIIPICSMWIYGGLRWDNWRQDLNGKSANPKIIPQLGAFLDLVRPQNILLAFVYTILGAYLAGGIGVIFTYDVLVAGLVVSLILAFGNVFNDYIDKDIDKFGCPDRPIPSGRISPLASGIFAVVLAVLAVFVAASLDTTLFIIALFTLSLSSAYSLYLKRTVLLGNVTTALLVALVILFGGLSVGVHTLPVWIASLLLFLYTLAMEVLYDVEDVEGDRQAAILTSATYFGPRRALFLYRALACLFMIAACWPWFAGWVSNLYLFAVIPCSILPTIWIVIVLGGEVSPRTMRQAVNCSWYVCFTSIVPVLLMNVG